MGSVGSMLPQLRQLSASACGATSSGRPAPPAVPSHQPLCDSCRSGAGRMLSLEPAAHRAAIQQRSHVAGRRHISVMAGGRSADGMPEMDDDST